jgi:hypothetical protein
MRALVREVPEDILKPRAQRAAQPSQDATKAAAVRTQIVSVDDDGDGPWHVTTAHVVTRGIDRPVKLLPPRG